MQSASNRDFNRVMKILEKYGLLLVSDAKLPSVAGIVAGEPIRGSWWAHPKCHDIFRVNFKLEESGSAIVCKLISGKQTFVHKRLWAAVAAVGLSGERWQADGLSALAKKLLKRVRDVGEVRTDSLSTALAGERKAIQAAVRELEQRLLVCSEDVHTESGAHAKVLLSWEAWGDRVKLGSTGLDVETAKRQLQTSLNRINQDFNADGALLWQPRRPTRNR